MKLLSAWRDSLSVFSPKNIDRFLLVTLNSMKQAYGVFFKYWWWLFTLTIFFNMQGFTWLSSFFLSGPAIVWWRVMLKVLLYSVAYFYFFLSMRPSMERKDFHYFLLYEKHILYYSVLVVIMSAVVYYVVNISSFTLFLAILLTFFVLSCFFTMFLLDGEGSVRSAIGSLCRAVKMVIYNAPFVIVTIFVMLMILIGLVFIGVSVTSRVGPVDLGWQAVYRIVEIIVLFLYITFFICFIANFYTQKIYGQYNLYFKSTNS